MRGAQVKMDGPDKPGHDEWGLSGFIEYAGVQ